MCGIAGAINFDGAAVEAATLAQMTDRLAHRGPDGCGYWRHGPVGLGHRRLSIIDVSPRGRQPLGNEDGTVWVVLNGEIYNYPELRRRLLAGGHRFASETDTEAIVHLYEDLGIACVDQLAGMFAFALWDTRRQVLYLVRDRLGIKPLFYWTSAARLLFASEIKALLAHCDVVPAAEAEALDAFLTFNYVPAPQTLFQQIRQLEPGHWLAISLDGTSRDRQYWDVPVEVVAARSERQVIEQFSHLLERVVRRHLLSDVPLGAFLSGGLDSSTVVYWMSQALAEPIQTFSVGFPQETHSELAYARATARALAVCHHEIVLANDAASILPKIVWHSEEPTADSSMVPLYYLAQSARRRVKVVLTGDGADELMGGYDTYAATEISRYFGRLPAWLRRGVLRPIVERLPPQDTKIGWEVKLQRFVNGAGADWPRAHAAWRQIFDPALKRRVYTPDFWAASRAFDPVGRYSRFIEERAGADRLNCLLRADLQFYLPNDILVKVDRMTMAHGLEARVPFLDHELVEFAMALPAGFKRARGGGKQLIKQAMRRRLPAAVVFRRKEGFNVPLRQWLRGELREFAGDTLGSKALHEAGVLNAVEIRRMFDDHLAGRGDYGFQLWGVLVLALWWQLFAAAPAPSRRS